MRRVPVYVVGATLAAGLLVPMSSAAMAAQSAPSSRSVGGSRCDVDGDGHGDLIVGAPRQGDDGALNVVFGTADGPGQRTQQITPRAGADYAWYGTTTACGDFDADGYDDVAIGAWGTDVKYNGRRSGAGVVEVVYGGPTGLDPARRLILKEGANLPGKPRRFDFLGYALVAGDFNANGVADLAIGAPNDGPRGHDCCGPGEVLVVPGARGTGLQPPKTRTWTQDSTHVPGKAEPLDHFGNALASGDFNADGRDDLAVASPYDPGDDRKGTVTVLYGSRRGLSATGAQRWSQDTPGIRGRSQKGDMFGQALAAGNLGRGRADDLAISVSDAGGAVEVLYGSSRGLTAGHNQLWTQNSPGVPGKASPGDHFGKTLAVGNIDGQGPDDLAVVTWDEDNGPNTVKGAVTVLPGSAQGVTGQGARRATAPDLGVPSNRYRALFGVAITIADLGATTPYLLIGAATADPQSAGVTKTDAGVVVVVPGGSGVPDATKATVLTADSLGPPNRTQSGELFGAGLTPSNWL